jgi:hypothetical protein
MAADFETDPPIFGSAWDRWCYPELLLDHVNLTNFRNEWDCRSYPEFAQAAAP